ncbi:hypothetical protein SISSUDRAFT_1052432 [Sistotremastrum suecicum HHB10207 ss-3]|uniref:Uncharacterized protein n=1 Tax=Sistotremastrum suecicum HHB10207 ss-3 TaxID=1314776 RepID=A0A165ZVQ9_9AGAM|nr:hypothetical protein SISSUDRAFT_1052432 [Sistotremastrum suecicum HHB10207 ss-3]
MGVTSISDNHLRTVSTDPLRRKLLQGTFQIPNEANLKGETMVTRMDAVHGQVFMLRRDGCLILDRVPCFVIQY